MFQNVDWYVSFLAKHKLSQQQFLFLWLIKGKKQSVIKKYMEAFPTDDGTMIGESSKKSLIDMGFLEQLDKGEGMNSYRVTDKFDEAYLKEEWAVAEETWRAYPPWVTIGGNDVPLTVMDKYEFTAIYCSRIGYSPIEHKEVLADIKFGRDKGLIRCSIEKFVRSQLWERIREVRLGQKVLDEVAINDLSDEF